MRIITGTARGCRLKVPRGMDTRPTADRIKESLFNILGRKVCDRRVMDLFAGTGNLGLEALSRGAACGLFVDRATESLIRENILRTKLSERAQVSRGDVFAVMERLERKKESFDLVFCDPPYRKGLWERVLLFLDDSPLFAENGILVVEHSTDEDDMPELGSLLCVRRECYGHTTQIRFFQRREYVGGDGD